MSKTWAELVTGDLIVDEQGGEWTVFGDVEPVNSGGLVELVITDGSRYVPVEKPATDKAPTPDADVPEILDELTHDAQVIAIETAKETQVRTSSGPKVYPNGKDMGTLKLRTHLYLVHEYVEVGGLSGVTDMLTAHNKVHMAAELKGIAHEHYTSDE